MTRTIFSIAVLCAAVFTPARAARAQVDLKSLTKQAQTGNVAAESLLGELYTSGRGVPQNDEEAAKWLRKAADQGDVDAEYDLGYLFQHGKGVRQDDSQAAAWYTKAAEKGNDWADVNLGFLYERGRGVKQDYAEAARLYRDAAEQRFRPGRVQPGSGLRARAWRGSGQRRGGQVVPEGG